MSRVEFVSTVGTSLLGNLVRALKRGKIDADLDSGPSGRPGGTPRP